MTASGALKNLRTIFARITGTPVSLKDDKIETCGIEHPH
jgi:hypothetical protein